MYQQPNSAFSVSVNTLRTDLDDTSRLRAVGSLSNEDLVAAAAGGDEAAWEQLVDRFSPLVWSVTRAFRLDHDTSCDVFQEVWVRLHTSLDKIHDPRRIAGWLSTTARNEAIGVLRSTKRERPDSSVTDGGHEIRAAVIDDFSSNLVRAEEHVVVAKALEELDERCQLLLRLVTAEPKVSYEEISAVMRIPIGSIGPTRSRCLAKLRAAIDRQGHNHD